MTPLEVAHPIQRARTQRLRSFDQVQSHVRSLQTLVALSWLAAAALGLVLSYYLAKRIVQPVKILDMAAAEVAKQNYGYRVPVGMPPFGNDELGRLGATFNSMCASIQSARQELIRQERMVGADFVLLFGNDGTHL